ncbi:triacylglycerol lipase OBL1-like isoform X2 [Nicotiana tomentosiformis]|uniref:triacylglycerol lipase OBL1-like isoform X2 n=1 Tax=Nicotiana tomentosiformis TaxID=4098 RepID=UPI00051C0D07|nr:uncharacterized protein LOC104102469 isoform X2 [Nicotiana tomentosiformis]
MAPITENVRFLIVKFENGGIWDLIRFGVWEDKESGAKFLEYSSTGDHVVEEEEELLRDDDEVADHRWVIFVSILVRKILKVFGKPMEWTGFFLEFMLNLFSLNGSSFLGLLYNIWHDYQKERSTQVFILCDKPKDANLILISFRGTEPFDADDWITDFDYSWYEIPKLGKVHMGFLEALGLGNRGNTSTFHEQLFVKNAKYTNSENVDPNSGSDQSSSDSEQSPNKTAYYAVRNKLKSLLKEHENARFVVTGHSLGGALAILFPTMLVMHEEVKVMQRLLGVYTYGQPRIGNRQLGKFMEAHLEHPVPKYFRVVYCNDLVPRLPYDDKTFLYKHFGICMYYNSLYIEQKVDEEPNRNFFGLRFVLPVYLNAGWEFIRSFTNGYIYGSEYKESWDSVLLRFVGLFVPGISAHSPVDYVNSIRLGRERSIQMSSF